MKYYLYNNYTKAYENTFVDREDMLAYLASDNHYKSGFSNVNKTWYSKQPVWNSYWANYCKFRNSDASVYNSFIADKITTTFGYYHKEFSVLSNEDILSHYLIIFDEDFKIFNPYSYKEEIFEETKRRRVVQHKKYSWEKQKVKCEFRKDPVPLSGMCHYHSKYYRQIDLHRIRKQEYNPEYKDYFRPKYRNQFGEHWWLENTRSRCKSKSWKDCTHKEKQWM